MKIRIDPIDQKYHYEIEHIVKLFFDEPYVYFHELAEEQEKERLSIRLHLEVKGEEIEVTAQLWDGQGNVYQESVIRDQNESKRAVNIALLKVLTAYTGVEQPWGTLTGVRPVKLVHNLRMQGMGYESIRDELRSNYFITDGKIEIMERIVKKQLEVVPDLYDLEREMSIYIGIPFCPTKCAYCTFPAYSIQGRQGSVDAFLSGLHEEIKQIGEWLCKQNIGITSIYFGGGTPTSITAEEMDAIFHTIAQSFPQRGMSRELTVEAGRPDTITPEKIEVMKSWKVDRISINPQSFTQETLQAIGRHHTVDEVLEKFHLARDMGMNNINMDLIIGLPGEGMEQYLHSLRMIKDLRPESLTVHTLSFKTASTMTKNREKYQVATREEVTEMIKVTERWTAEEGYHPYYLYRQKNILGNQENVGYALPGRESIYNIMIMEEKQTILGLGCGAASKIISPRTRKITRYANPKEPKVYNEHYQEYIERKLQILDEEYGEDRVALGF